MREKFGLSKRRGRKPKKTIHDVLRKIEELSDKATIGDVADKLKVDERTVERVIKPYVEILRELDPTCVGFEGLQAVVKGKGKRKPLIPSSRHRKLLPD